MRLRSTAAFALIAAVLLGVIVGQAEAGEALARSIDELALAGVIEAVETPVNDTLVPPTVHKRDDGSLLDRAAAPSDAVPTIDLGSPRNSRLAPRRGTPIDRSHDSNSRRLATLQRLLV